MSAKSALWLLMPWCGKASNHQYPYCPYCWKKHIHCIGSFFYRNITFIVSKIRHEIIFWKQIPGYSKENSNKNHMHASSTSSIEFFPISLKGAQVRTSGTVLLLPTGECIWVWCKVLSSKSLVWGRYALINPKKFSTLIRHIWNYKLCRIPQNLCCTKFFSSNMARNTKRTNSEIVELFVYLILLSRQILNGWYGGEIT